MINGVAITSNASICIPFIKVCFNNCLYFNKKFQIKFNQTFPLNMKRGELPPLFFANSIESGVIISVSLGSNVVIS